MVKKVWRTDRQTDGRTDWTIHRAAWSQLKTMAHILFYINTYVSEMDKVEMYALCRAPWVSINYSGTFRWVQTTRFFLCQHDSDVIKWKHLPRHWPFVRGNHRSPVNSPHKDQWRRALMFPLIFAWIIGWVNNREAGDLRRLLGHHDVTVMILWNFCQRNKHIILVANIIGVLYVPSSSPVNLQTYPDKIASKPIVTFL